MTEYSELVDNAGDETQKPSNELQALRSENIELCYRIEEMTKSRMKESNKIASQIREMEKRLSTSTTDFCETKRRLEEDLDRKNGEIRKSLSEISKLKNEHEKTEEKFKNSYLENLNLEERLFKTEEDLEKAMEDLDIAKAKIANLEVEKQQNIQSLEKKESELREVKDKSKTLTEKFEQMKAEKEKFEKNFLTANQRIKNFENLTLKNNKVIAELNARISNNEGEKNMRIQTENEYRKKETLSESHHVFAELLNELERVKNKELEINEFKNRVCKIRFVLNFSLSEFVFSLVDFIDQIFRENKNLDQEIKKFEISEKNKNSELKMIKDKYSAEMNQIKKLSFDKDCLEKEMSEKKELLESQKDKILQLEKQVQDLSVENKNLQEDSKNHEFESKDDCVKCLEYLEIIKNEKSKQICQTNLDKQSLNNVFAEISATIRKLEILLKKHEESTISIKERGTDIEYSNSSLSSTKSLDKDKPLSNTADEKTKSSVKKTSENKGVGLITYIKNMFRRKSKKVYVVDLKDHNESDLFYDPVKKKWVDRNKDNDEEENVPSLPEIIPRSDNAKKSNVVISNNNKDNDEEENVPSLPEIIPRSDNAKKSNVRKNTLDRYPTIGASSSIIEKPKPKVNNLSAPTSPLPKTFDNVSNSPDTWQEIKALVARLRVLAAELESIEKNPSRESFSPSSSSTTLARISSDSEVPDSVLAPGHKQETEKVFGTSRNDFENMKATPGFEKRIFEGFRRVLENQNKFESILEESQFDLKDVKQIATRGGGFDKRTMAGGDMLKLVSSGANDSRAIVMSRDCSSQVEVSETVRMQLERVRSKRTWNINKSADDYFEVELNEMWDQNGRQLAESTGRLKALEMKRVKSKRWFGWELACVFLAAVLAFGMYAINDKKNALEHVREFVEKSVEIWDTLVLGFYRQVVYRGRVAT